MNDDALSGPICDYQEITATPQVFPAPEVCRTGVIIFEKNDSLRAFENVCPHAFARLDFSNTPIVAFDGYHILCNVHGAHFDPNSGTCVSGPCLGARLTPLSVKVINEKIFVVKTNFHHQ